MADLRPLLAELLPLRRSSDKLLAAGPAPASPAAAAAALPLGELAWILGSMFWGAASDNLLAWHYLAARAQVQPMIAHGTLARGSIEGAVMTRWLVEPGIGAAEHRNRGASAQLSDYRLRMQFEQERWCPRAIDRGIRSPGVPTSGAVPAL